MLVRAASVVSAYVVQVVEGYLYCSEWTVVNVPTLTFCAVPVTHYVEFVLASVHLPTPFTWSSLSFLLLPIRLRCAITLSSCAA